MAEVWKKFKDLYPKQLDENDKCKTQANGLMMLENYVKKYSEEDKKWKVITVEDGCLMGGFGSAVLEFMVDQKYSAEVIRLGIPDEYIHHGTQEELWADCGFDKKAIIECVQKMLSLNKSEKKLTGKVS